MSIVNSSAVFEDHMPKIRRSTVVIEYGKPIDIKSLDKDTRKNIGNYVSGIIGEAYFRNKAEYFPD